MPTSGPASVTEPALLDVEDLRVTYGPIVAVDSISFTLASGDVLALLGSNGAGKSTTLRAISGLTPFEGKVTFEGRSVAGRSPERLARAGLIHVPEGRRIFPTLTVHENLQVAATPRGDRADALGVDDVYELFPPLADLCDRGGWALSGGEQQMLAIGRGLVGAPRVLLLDEPSLGLAPTIVDVVFDALAEIRHRVPLLLVEQNTAVALEVCTRVIVLSEGRVALTGTPDELSDRSDLIDSYLGTRDLQAGDAGSD